MKNEEEGDINSMNILVLSLTILQVYKWKLVHYDSTAQYMSL